MESEKDFAEKRVEELSTKVDALNKEVGRLHHLEQLRNSTSILTARTGERELTRSSRNGMKCFQCGQPGHFARNCPQKTAGGHEKSCFGWSDEMKRPNLQSRMCSQKSRFSVADAIYLKLNMGGQVCPSVLDTGSNLTLIPTKYVKDADIKKTNHTPRAVNETTIRVLGEVSLPFVVGRYRGMINGVVTEHVADVILGMDWITEHVTSWEFNRSRVKIGGNYHKLTSRSSDNSWCRRVIPQQDVVIKPRSEVDLSTKVALKRLSDARQSVIVPERGRPEFNTNFVSRVAYLRAFSPQYRTSCSSIRMFSPNRKMTVAFCTSSLTK